MGKRKITEKRRSVPLCYATLSKSSGQKTNILSVLISDNVAVKNNKRKKAGFVLESYL